ncbi:uncharacterized protein LOC129002023 [Macrosteles quadrilineatus]|uniref:uncharacterized protein LOC129002023 n=1 Tax=Macrosteles quadrilineatus TaxID=74068 RepID=UPI0023E2273D|nr:uncharacterized protein LOC129002023 [Macrosteles quadrilineatus]
MDQLAFGVVAAFNDQMPDPTSPLYTWPGDLLTPDVIFFLNLPSHNRKNMFKENDTLTFRSRLIQYYRNWKGTPPIVEINNTNVHRDVTNIMMGYIERRLNYWRHLEPPPPMYPVGNDMGYR